VLLLIFDTRRATVQAKGAAEASASGLLTADNVVAIYDPKRLTPRGVKQLRYTLQAAIRKSRSHPA